MEISEIPKTKQDWAIERLRDLIIKGEIEPGDRLRQVDLADRLGMSPTPVREALRKLEAEGLVTYTPHKGVTVAEYTPEDAAEVYQIRAVLEELATHLATPNLSDESQARLHEVHTQFVDSIAAGQLFRLRAINYDFHMLIYQASENPTLVQIILGLWMKFPWDTLYVIPDRARQSAEEHSQILRALDAQDGELAGRLARRHIESAHQWLVEHLEKQRPVPEDQNLTEQGARFQ